MKILHVLSSPRAEGTPRIVLDWLGSGLKIEQDVLFLESSGELKAYYQCLPFWQYYNELFQISTKNIFKLIKLVRQITEKRKPDVLICWNTGLSPWIVIGGHLGGCKKITTHAGNFAGKSSDIKSLIHTNISGWTHRILNARIICCSRYVMESYKKMPFSPSSVYSHVNNCITLKKFSGGPEWDKRENDFIMVATLERHKDHVTLLKAWKLLEGEGYQYTLKIVGDGSLKNELLKIRDELGLKTVHFLGSRNDVSALLKGSKFFVFSTTIQEGFGTVLLEALSAGCKVIASNVPACSEVLENGRWGRLFKAGSEADLFQTVTKCHAGSGFMINNSLLIDFLGSFDVSQMIRSYIELS